MIKKNILNLFSLNIKLYIIYFLKIFNKNNTKTLNKLITKSNHLLIMKIIIKQENKYISNINLGNALLNNDLFVIEFFIENKKFNHFNIYLYLFNDNNKDIIDNVTNLLIFHYSESYLTDLIIQLIKNNKPNMIRSILRKTKIKPESQNCFFIIMAKNFVQKDVVYLFWSYASVKSKLKEINHNLFDLLIKQDIKSKINGF